MNVKDLESFEKVDSSSKSTVSVESRYSIHPKFGELTKNEAIEKFGSSICEFINDKMSKHEIGLICEAFSIDKSNAEELKFLNLKEEQLEAMVYGYRKKFSFPGEALAEVPKDDLCLLVDLCDKYGDKFNLNDIFNLDGSQVDYTKVKELYNKLEGGRV
jgi:hypothetical protein